MSSRHPSLAPSAATPDSGYAWLRLLAAMLLTTVGCAGMYISMVGVPAYQGDFGVGRGDGALPFTLVMLGFGVGGVLIGRMVDSFGVVVPLAVCVVALAGMFVMAGMAESYWVFCLLHAGLGAFGCAAVFSPLLADISRWFVRRRGFAIAACASGNYLAGTVWPPTMQASIDLIGWRDTYEALAVVSLAVMLPLLLILRPRPPVAMADLPGGGTAGSARALGLSPAGLIALLCLAGVGCCTAMAMPQVHVVALTADLGFAVAQGAQMLSLMFGLGVLSRLVFGWISDRIGGLRTLIIGSALQCLALVAFLPADTLVALYLASGMFGLFQGGIVPCYALVVREYFPVERAGVVTGTVVFATLIGMAFGGWVSGAIFDWTGSYEVAFLHGIAWNLVNMVVIGFLVIRSSPGRVAAAT